MYSIIWMVTILSKTLNKKGKLATGLYFFHSFGLRFCFFSNGIMCDNLKALGTTPDESDTFIMLVIRGRSSSRHFLTSYVGKGMSWQQLDALSLINLQTVSSETCLKSVNLLLHDSVKVMVKDGVLTLSRFSHIFLILSWKNEPNRSASSLDEAWSGSTRDEFIEFNLFIIRNRFLSSELEIS